MRQSGNEVRQRLIEAAVQLFSCNGFNGTSTRDITRVADVNEASLFRFFNRKQDVFWAALESRLNTLRVRKELQVALAEHRRPGEVLPLVVELVVQTALFQPELVRLLYVGMLELQPGTVRIFRQHLAPLAGDIYGYLMHCMDSGQLRKVDASVTAVAFLSTVLAHQSIGRMFQGACTTYANSEEAIASYSNFWLELLLP